jgi:hypothetical protein
MTRDNGDNELESITEEMLEAEFSSAREAEGRITLTIY